MASNEGLLLPNSRTEQPTTLACTDRRRFHNQPIALASPSSAAC
jgi:hypothetical protein